MQGHQLSHNSLVYGGHCQVIERKADLQDKDDYIGGAQRQRYQYQAPQNLVPSIQDGYGADLEEGCEDKCRKYRDGQANLAK